MSQISVSRLIPYATQGKQRRHSVRCSRREGFGACLAGSRIRLAGDGHQLGSDAAKSVLQMVAGHNSNPPPGSKGQTVVCCWPTTDPGEPGSEQPISSRHWSGYPWQLSMSFTQISPFHSHRHSQVPIVRLLDDGEGGSLDWLDGGLDGVLEGVLEG